MKTIAISSLLASTLIVTPGVTAAFVSRVVRLPPINATHFNSTSKFGINAAEGEVCTIAQGVDFKGGDLWSVSGGSNECCGHCLATSECTAYTWTDYAGGTCWLKSEVAELAITLGTESCIMSDDTAPVVMVSDDCDMPGNDMGSVNIQSDDPSSCYEFCWKVPACNVVTWTNDNGGTCYFKTAASEREHKPGASTGVVFKANY